MNNPMTPDDIMRLADIAESEANCADMKGMRAVEARRNRLNRLAAELRQLAQQDKAGGVADDVQDRIDTLLSRMEGFGKAYPLDMFPEPTKDQTAWLHKERPGLCDRIAASMGRHVANMIAEDLKALRAALTAPQPKATP